MKFRSATGRPANAPSVAPLALFFHRVELIRGEAGLQYIYLCLVVKLQDTGSLGQLGSDVVLLPRRVS
jgi:hypothetical protein